MSEKVLTARIVIAVCFTGIGDGNTMLSFGELFAAKPSHYLPPVIRDLMWNVTMVAGG